MASFSPARCLELLTPAPAPGKGENTPIHVPAVSPEMVQLNPPPVPEVPPVPGPGGPGGPPVPGPGTTPPPPGGGPP